MDKLQKTINKQLKKYNIKLSESAVSMILGAIVVILIGFLAYNYFRQQSVTSQNSAAMTANQETSGQLTDAGSAVALPTTHIVAEGEDLWTIAEKYYKSGYNFVDIANANSLGNPNFLEVGQKLTIPKVEVRVPLTVASTMTPTVTESKIDGATYDVIKGDDLWSIAVRAYGDGYKWTELASANKLENPDLIFAGTVLSIPR